jgi:hypothetical protein
MNPAAVPLGIEAGNALDAAVALGLMRILPLLSNRSVEIRPP